MEVTAAVKNSTYTEGSTLTDKINRYILSNRASIASIAKEIAYSPYISEQNGDNRDLYRRNIIALEAEIRGLSVTFGLIQK